MPYFFFGCFFFNWNIVDLQCCANLCYTAKWLSYTFHYGLSQDIEYSSLCQTVGSCCLSILHIIVCCCWVNSFVSDSVRCYRRQPTRLPHPWDPPGKNTGVGTYNSLHFANPKSQSFLPPSPPPWQLQICFLYLWVCFSFVDRFICAIFSIPHVNEIVWYFSFSSDFISLSMVISWCITLLLFLMHSLWKQNQGHPLAFWQIRDTHSLEQNKNSFIHYPSLQSSFLSINRALF